LPDSASSISLDGLLFKSLTQASLLSDSSLYDGPSGILAISIPSVNIPETYLCVANNSSNDLNDDICPVLEQIGTYSCTFDITFIYITTSRIKPVIANVYLIQSRVKDSVVVMHVAIAVVHWASS
jgi:hypothetical protein